jgi:hypothetical protein
LTGSRLSNAIEIAMKNFRAGSAQKNASGVRLKFSVGVPCCSSGDGQEHEKQIQTDSFTFLQVGLAKKNSRGGHLNFFRQGLIERLAHFKRDRDHD